MQDKSTLKIRAYNIIKEKIVSCKLEPGSPVSEKDLMDEIGVSRTPVREALGLLESEKLVKVYPKRGVFVTDISEKEILDIYTMRICLESTAVKLAVPFLDDEKDIDRYLALYSAKDYSVSFEEHLDIDRQFHLDIARASRNSYMYETIAHMYDLNTRIRRRFISHDRERMEQSRREHLKILKHLKQRDGERAGDAMRNHISVGMKGALAIPPRVV